MKMKINKQCDKCKNKCKVYSPLENIDIFCKKFEKVVNEQIKFKLK